MDPDPANAPPPAVAAAPAAAPAPVAACGSVPESPVRTVIVGNLSCLHCGYNLRGLIRPRCPECGAIFSRRDLRSGHRRRSEPAFWSMYLLVLTQPVSFWRDHAPYLTAQQPRWFCLICAVCSSMLGTLIVVVREAPPQGWTLSSAAIAATLIAIVGTVPLLAISIVLASLGILSAKSRGARSDGAGWRAAAAGAVWFPAWGIILAMVFLNFAPQLNSIGGPLPLPSLPSWLSVLATVVAALTLSYAGAAMVQEERSTLE